MSRSARRELDSRLIVLVAHLLKWRFQPQRAGRSWLGTIDEQRRAINALLQRYPSLLTISSSRLQVNYERALRSAEKDAALPRDVLPSDCPFALDEVLDPAFLPTAPKG